MDPHEIHPNLTPYKSGGIGHLAGDESRSVVGMVPLHALEPMRDHDGLSQHPGDHDRRRVDEIRADLRSGHGLEHPIQVFHDERNHWGYIGEGNHRLRALAEEGHTHAPVQVHSRSRLQHKMDEGVGAPLHMATDFSQGDYPYTPPNVHPHHFAEFAPGGKTAAVTFPGKHDEQLPLHPDLGAGMEENGLYKGTPQLPLYRGLQLHHPEDVRDHLGKSHEGDQAIAHHFVNQVVRGGGRAPNTGHQVTLGIHWSHDKEATGDLANHAYMDRWGGHDHESSHPVMLEADHPGHEHVLDFHAGPEHPDHKVVSDTVGTHEFHQHMLPEVPLRPGAPVHLRAIHVQKHDGSYHRIPVGLHTQAAAQPRGLHRFWLPEDPHEAHAYIQGLVGLSKQAGYDDDRLREIHSEGGYTTHVHSEHSPKSGFMASYDGTGHVHHISELHPGHIAKHREEFAQHLAHPHTYQGGWHDTETGHVFLDVSKHHTDEHEAREFAVQHRQKAYFHLDTFDEKFLDPHVDPQKHEDPEGWAKKYASVGTDAHPGYASYRHLYDVTPKPESTGRTAAYEGWRPHDRLFGPTKDNVDPRLFDENRHMLPAVRQAIVSMADHFLSRYSHDWQTWARVYLAGSEASLWWGNNDFDILVGVHYDRFRERTRSTMRDEEITDLLNADFRERWNDEEWHPPFRKDETWHLTGYVNPNSWDIRKIKPYAAYEIVTGQWFVPPVVTPKDWGPDKFPESTWRMAENYANEIAHLHRLGPGPVQQRHAETLFNHIHEDRKRAFGPSGTGVFDVGNVAEKYLDQRPDHPLALLVEMKNQGKAGVSKEAMVPGNVPHVQDGLLHHSGGNEWHHGTPHDFHHFDDEHPDDSDVDSMDHDIEVHGAKHWNTFLGTHWTSRIDTAQKFSRGLHHNDTGSKDDGYIHTANLGITSPKHYGHEDDLDGEAFQHHWDHGLHDREDPFDHHGDVCDKPDCHHISEHREDDDVTEHVHGEYAANPRLYLNAHPYKEEIAAHFRSHLKERGHDGITYGNSDPAEGPVGHPCAITFDHSQVQNHVRRQVPRFGRVASAAPTWFHGTSVDGAKGIIRDGIRPGSYVADHEEAKRWAGIQERHHPSGGVVVEGTFEGESHPLNFRNEHESWKGARETGATHLMHPSGKIGAVVQHGAFKPVRLHYPDGRVEDVSTKKEASVGDGLPEGYSYRHIVHQPKFGSHRYGDSIPHPSQEQVYNEGPNKAFDGAHMFEHQIVHRGTPVAKLRYSMHPDEPHVLNIEGLAVHNDHQGKGLAIHLGDHMQDHAEREGCKIDHGTYTDQGHYFAQKWMSSPKAKPHLHLPYPDKPTGTTGADFMPHMLDPHEMKAGEVGRTASAGHEREEAGGLKVGNWVHLAGPLAPGWAEPQTRYAVQRTKVYL